MSLTHRPGSGGLLLTPEDRQSINNVLDWHFEDNECRDERDEQAFHVKSAVEQIVARHVAAARAAALNEAADIADSHAEKCPQGCESTGCGEANRVTADWLRNLAANPPP